MRKKLIGSVLHKCSMFMFGSDESKKRFENKNTYVKKEERGTL